MADRWKPDLQLRRVYDHADEPTAYRILVDRLWPRGLSRADAALDEWARDVAPSTELRRWYGHAPDRFDEFARRYHAELGGQPAAATVDRLLDLARERRVVLLTATRDLDRSGGRVLLDHLVAVARGSA